jgi:hypothetical protein
LSGTPSQASLRGRSVTQREGAGLNIENQQYSIEYELREDDIHEYLEFRSPPGSSRIHLVFFILQLLTPLVLIILGLMLYRGSLWLLIALILWWILFGYAARFPVQILEKREMQKAVRALKDRIRFGKHTLLCTSSGIKVQNELGERSLGWGDLSAILETDYHVIFTIGGKEDVFVPNTFFSSKKEYDEFLNFSRYFFERAEAQCPRKLDKKRYMVIGVFRNRDLWARRISHEATDEII